MFSTVHDSQREICILIYSGNSAVASKNELLGQFDLTGLPSSKARTLQIEVLCLPLLATSISMRVCVCVCGCHQRCPFLCFCALFVSGSHLHLMQHSITLQLTVCHCPCAL